MRLPRTSSALVLSVGLHGGLTSTTPPSTTRASDLAIPGPNEYVYVRAGSEGSTRFQVSAMGPAVARRALAGAGAT